MSIAKRLTGVNARQIDREVFAEVKFSADGNSWSCPMNGMMRQGGSIQVTSGSTVTVNFEVPYLSQVMNFSMTPVSAVDSQGRVTALTSAGFTITNPGVTKTYYWSVEGL